MAVKTATGRRPSAARNSDPQSSAGKADDARLSDRTYALIRDDIISCVLAPGEAVTEAQLADRYGVGKAPIRSSLTRLRQDSLVEPLARRGYLIAPIAIRDVHEVYQARLIVEPECARLAAGHLDGGQMERLDAVISVGYTPGDRASEIQWLEANRSFHLAIAEASGNSRLASIVSGLLLQCDRIIHLAMQLDTDAEQRFRHGHERMIEALVAGDPEGAHDEAQAAISAGRDTLLEVLLRSPSLLGAELRLPLTR